VEASRQLLHRFKEMVHSGQGNAVDPFSESPLPQEMHLPSIMSGYAPLFFNLVDWRITRELISCGHTKQGRVPKKRRL
jgi:hypothetical protein